MRINEYHVISEAVESGVTYGFARAFKHTNQPSNEAVCAEIIQAVMSSLCECITFEDTEVDLVDPLSPLDLLRE